MVRAWLRCQAGNITAKKSKFLGERLQKIDVEKLKTLRSFPLFRG